MLQKRFTGKTTECSRHLRHSAIEKDILSKLNRCIFQISLKYIKLVVPKILFILVLCSFNFYFKITWPPPPTTKLAPATPVKTFLKLFSPPFFLGGEGSCRPWKRKDSLKTRAVLSIFSLELEISGVAVQSIHQNSKKWQLPRNCSGKMTLRLF